jgi:hypothetical protein
MHQTQKILLKRLATQNDQKYSDLTRGYDFEDNVVFHLKMLAEKNYVEKKRNIYSITAEGIKQIYSYELSDLTSPGVKTFFVGFIVSDDKEYYLLKGHPAAKTNFYNLPSGRPKFGEKMEEALVRLFFENTGLNFKPARFKYHCLHAKIIKTTNGESLFDDGQAMFELKISAAEKAEMKLTEGVNWYAKNKIKLLDNCWPEIGKCILQKKVEPYDSYEIVSDYKL